MQNRTFEIPIKTPNPLNQSHRHWKAAAGIRKRQRMNALKVVPKLDLEPVVEVRLIRLSAGRLDDSNLGGALKAVQDAVAFRLGVDDASGLVRWVMTQEDAPRDQQAVRVEVRWLVRQSMLERARALGPFPSSVLACAEAPTRDEET